MVYKKITPNLIVDEVNATIEFYRTLLKFELTMTVPGNDGNKDITWALMKRDDIEIMFQSRKSSVREIPIMEHKEAGGSLTLYIEMDNVADLYESLQGKDVIIEELHSKPYGMREFSMQDCNGFVLTFAEKADEKINEIE